MASLLTELKRRKIFQVAAVYAVVAWLLVQVVATIEEPLRLPEWFDTAIIVLLLIGFPITLIMSWAFNVTPEGLQRDEGAENADAKDGRRIEYVLIGLLVFAVAWLFYRDLRAPEEEIVSAPTVLAEPVISELEAPGRLPNSVAVLPFDNLSLNPEDAFFAAGIHDTILKELARIRNLNVIARTSVMQYQDGTTPIPDIAEDLNVETVMEGSVQYADGRVLVTVQLIDADTNAHMWSESYDRDFAGIFEIQADIATKIAEALEAELSPEERQSLETGSTTSEEAMALVLKAQSWWEFSRDARIQMLDQAIELDPQFARAWAHRAYYRATKIVGTINESDANRLEEQVLQDAEVALKLDPQLGYAYAGIGQVHLSRGRVTEAEAAFEKAMELSPNDTEVLDRYSVFWMRIENFDAAIPLARRAVELDPGNSELHDALADSLRFAGDLAGAAASYRRALEVNEDVYEPHLHIGILETGMGDHAEALAELRLFETLRRDPRGDLAYAYARLGRQDYADRVIERIEAQAATGEDDIGIHESSLIDMARQDYPAALARLKRGIADGEMSQFLQTSSGLIKYNLTNDPVLEQPEWVEVRQQLGYQGI